MGSVSGRHVAVVMGLVLLALSAHQLRTVSHSRREAARSYEAVYYLPPRRWLPLFSLGWDEAVADLIWMRALVYFGDEFRHEGGVDHVFEYADAMLTLDPDFEAVYRWVGVAGLYRPVAITAEDVERTVAIMERGVDRFPENGELEWSIGAALAFELPPLLDDPEAADEARQRALPHLTRAARLGAAPPWMTLTNASLFMRLGQTEQAARHLEEMYQHLDDPDLRAQVEERIRSLRERAQADALFETMRRLEEERRRDFPYLPADLYLLVGPRPPVDLEAPLSRGLPWALSENAAPTFPGPPP